MTARGWGIAAVVLAAMLWGSTGTMQALLPPDRVALAVGALRIVIGGLALVALAAARGEIAAMRHLPRRTLILTALGIIFYNLLFFSAVSRAGVGVGTAVGIGSGPLWVTLWDLIRTGRPPRGAQLVGRTLAVVGVALLMGAQGGGPDMALGLAMAVGAGGCYAFYSVLTSQMSAHAPPAAIAGASFGLAGLAMIPLLVAIPPLWVLTPQAMLAMLFLGVIATGLSYALYTWGLTRVAPATAVTLALAEPLTAWVLATGVLGEAITPLKALGALALLAGLVLVARVPSQRS